MNPEATQENYAMVFASYAEVYTGYYFVQEALNHNKYWFRGNGGSAWQPNSSTVDIPANSWTHVTIVRTGTTVSLYTNGSLAYQDTNAVASTISYGSSNPQLTLGGVSNSNAYNGWAGDLDDFRVWTRALDSSEVSALYTETTVSDSGAYDWTHGGQLTNIVKFSRGMDFEGNPSYAYAKKEDDNTTSLYFATDFTNFATFGLYNVGVTNIVGAPVCMEYGTAGRMLLGTDAGKVYEIMLVDGSIPTAYDLKHSMAGGEPINSAKYDFVNLQWIFEAGGKVYTIDSLTQNVIERYTLPAGAKIVDIASGDSGIAMIIRKADFSLEPIIATSNWSEISDEAAMSAAIVGLEVIF
jgi:hypothetical protein